MPQNKAFSQATRWLASGPFYMTAASTQGFERDGFQVCRLDCFKEAARKASPIVLESVMSVDIVVPEEHLGKMIGELNGRRGRVENMERRNASATIQAAVPLSELLRSSAHGKPAYPMRFAGYEPAPRAGWDEADGAGVTANRPKAREMEEKQLGPPEVEPNKCETVVAVPNH